MPDRSTECRAYIDLISHDGDLVTAYEQLLGENEHVHVRVAELVDRFEGSIGVRLVPIEPLSHSHRYIATLYFLSWADDRGHVQFSHEQNRMTFDVESP